jgi:hypothetical protein
MRIKFVLSMLFIAVSIGTAIWRKIDLSSSPTPSVFTVNTKDGETMNVVGAQLDPLFEMSNLLSRVDIENKRGFFYINKNLEDVNRIEVLSQDGTQLKVTYRNGQVLEGKREYKKDIVRDKPQNPMDYLRGKLGELNVNLSLADIVSITRKEKGNE